MDDLDSYLQRRLKTQDHIVEPEKGKPPTLLLLTCIDLRYPVVIHCRMEPVYHKRYDHVCLAGASLAPVVDFGQYPKPHWRDTFLDHVAVAKKLHHISEVLVMNHRSCGAFEEFGVLEPGKYTPEQELEAHRTHALRLQKLLNVNFSELRYHAILLGVEPKYDPAKPCSEQQRLPIDVLV